MNLDILNQPLTPVSDLAISVIVFAYSAFVLRILWNTFVSPFGVKKINTIWAIGLVILLYTLLYVTFPTRLVSPVENTESSSIMSYVKMVSRLSIILLSALFLRPLMPKETKGGNDSSFLSGSYRNENK
ncbi:hypothetical protein ABLV18_27370 [Klebsiella sp. CN_Kp114]|uniref:hypothetical protein n=1 Tax=unclassified Klebsiella TaxID=2608929 RepID=UPI0032B4F0F5